jgi:hypothetical protein
MKAGGKQSNRLARNVGLYEKQEGSGRVGFISLGQALRQNKTARLT